MDLPPRKKLKFKSEDQKEILEKTETLKSIRQRLRTNRYQTFVKIFQYVLEHFNELITQRVAGIDFLCLPATPTSIYHILQSPDKEEFELGSDDNPISSQSVYHNKSASLSDGAIEDYGDMYNFHYDDLITEATNGISMCWVSCVSKFDIEKCGTVVANDEGKRVIFWEDPPDQNSSQDSTGWIDDSTGWIDKHTGLVYLNDATEPLSIGNLPLDHIIIADFGKQLHSPPPSNYLERQVLYRLFLSIELNPNNPTVQEFNANVKNLASTSNLTLNLF